MKGRNFVLIRKLGIRSRAVAGIAARFEQQDPEPTTI
jgi:hypothetical protein